MHVLSPASSFDTRARGPVWWQWPTALSLDAPLVALAWQAAVARAARVQLPLGASIVLGASVWLAYAADRWIEGWRLAPAQVRTARLGFYQRQRWPVAGVWLTVLVADLVVAARSLSAADWRGGFVLCAAVLAYLLSHQLIHRDHPWRVPKEICVAGLLAAGVGLFVVDRPHDAEIWVVLACFAGLAVTNCTLISCWESEVDRAHGQTSLALQFPRAAGIGRLLPWGVIIGAAVLMASPVTPLTDVAAACTVASGVLLALIDWLEPRIGWRAARVLADAALLTPVLMIVHGG